MKMDGDDSKDKCVYFMEDKNQDELFEVLELSVDGMDNVEVAVENNEPYHHETTQTKSIVKCETITGKWELIDNILKLSVCAEC